jgi:hypothetical protein
LRILVIRVPWYKWHCHMRRLGGAATVALSCHWHPGNIKYCHVLSDYRRVLDGQLDLLDHTQLQCITLYNSQQLSLFSCSEDSGSNCCNQLLWHPLPSLVITDSLTNCFNQPTNRCPRSCPAIYRVNRPQRKHPLLHWLLLPRNRPHRKRWSLPLLCVYPLLSNGYKHVSTVDCFSSVQ